MTYDDSCSGLREMGIKAQPWAMLAGNLGCLLNMAGRLTRQGGAVRVRHVAEVPAGMTGDVPPISHATDGGRPC